MFLKNIVGLKMSTQLELNKVTGALKLERKLKSKEVSQGHYYNSNSLNSLMKLIKREKRESVNQDLQMKMQ